MRTVKLIIAAAILATSITSCNKSELTENAGQERVETSETARLVTSTLKTKVSANNGTTVDLQRRLEADFGFKFVYPVTLSYNTGTEVEVTSDTELLSIAEGLTTTEYVNGIGFPFSVQRSSGNDTVSNENEFSGTINSHDTDGDGVPNYQDSDDDGDGISDEDEDVNGDGMETNDDTDGDGVPNYQDTDDDGDGVPTANEDVNHDGDPSNDDSDGDGVPNYQDTDSDNDGLEDGNDTDADGNGIEDSQEGNEGNEGNEGSDDDDNDSGSDNDGGRIGR